MTRLLEERLLITRALPVLTSNELLVGPDCNNSNFVGTLFFNTIGS